MENTDSYVITNMRFYYNLILIIVNVNDEHKTMEIFKKKYSVDSNLIYLYKIVIIK